MVLLLIKFRSGVLVDFLGIKVSVVQGSTVEDNNNQLSSSNSISRTQARACTWCDSSFDSYAISDLE